MTWTWAACCCGGWARSVDVSTRLWPQVVMEFNDVSSAAKARAAMHGRRFAGRVVNATYLTEEAYFSGRYDG